MALSVTDAVGKAYERMAKVLFKPFDIGKWFVLGFCAFLSTCDDGGGGNIPTNWGGRGGGGGGGTGPSTQEIIAWINNNLSVIMILTVAALLLILGLTALMTWLGSRGKFMFLDGIVRNRGAVAEPWKELRQLANSRFQFAFTLRLIALVVTIGIIALGLTLAWPDIQAQNWGESATIGLVVGVSILIVAMLGFLVIGLLLDDFVVPAMYLRNQRVMDAWRTVRQELLAGHFGKIVVFYLMKIVLGIAVSVIALMATCVTCCIAALPYLGAVILLPLLVFMRCYSLCFIEQYGPAWKIFRHDEWSGLCARCGYDLRNASESGVCPECGTPYLAPMAH